VAAPGRGERRRGILTSNEWENGHGEVWQATNHAHCSLDFVSMRIVIVLVDYALRAPATGGRASAFGIKFLRAAWSFL
jgi:hypothetical protein